MKDKIKEVYAEAEKISATWNGEDGGLHEDRATIAIEIMSRCTEIEELLDELK